MVALVCIFAALLVLAGTFVVGARYGRNAEKKASSALRAGLDSIDRKFQ